MTDEFTKKREEAMQKLNLGSMHLGKDGPLNNLANVAMALEQTPCFAGAFAYDVLAQNAVMVRDTPVGKAGPVTDHTILLLAQWCQNRKFNASPTVVRDGLGAIAMSTSFHPVRRYLKSLEWDGKQRIGEWLHRYAGAELSDYTRSVGSKWLIAGVARAMQPGCKVDTMLVFEGDQGIGKSTAFKILGGEWFSDQISSFGSKDSSMEATRWWIIEVAEMDAMSRSEASAIKAFMSRQVERFRLPFGRIVSDIPRSCVFGGTLNPSGGFLKDPSGARRFWPVEIKRKIDNEALQEDRDQLWAEALHWYNEGVPHWLTSLEEVEARERQENRFDVDAWENSLSKQVLAWHKQFVNQEVELRNAGMKDENTLNQYLYDYEITMDRIATEGLEMKLPDIDRPTQTRIGNIMIRLGFVKKRIKRGDLRFHVYRKAEGKA